jgi:hypothetical protein
MSLFFFIPKQKGKIHNDILFINQVKENTIIYSLYILVDDSPAHETIKRHTIARSLTTHSIELSNLILLNQIVVPSTVPF